MNEPASEASSKHAPISSSASGPLQGHPVQDPPASLGVGPDRRRERRVHESGRDRIRADTVADPLERHDAHQLACPAWPGLDGDVLECVERIERADRDDRSTRSCSIIGSAARAARKYGSRRSEPEVIQSHVAGSISRIGARRLTAALLTRTCSSSEPPESRVYHQVGGVFPVEIDHGRRNLEARLPGESTVRERALLAPVTSTSAPAEPSPAGEPASNAARRPGDRPRRRPPARTASTGRGRVRPRRRTAGRRSPHSPYMDRKRVEMSTDHTERQMTEELGDVPGLSCALTHAE